MLRNGRAGSLARVIREAEMARHLHRLLQGRSAAPLLHQAGIPAVGQGALAEVGAHQQHVARLPRHA
eukprot:8680613-Pyramimonas_sp.AAC.1